MPPPPPWRLLRLRQRVAGRKTAGKIGHNDSERFGLRAFLDEDGTTRHIPACFRIFATKPFTEILLGMRNHDYYQAARRIQLLPIYGKCSANARFARKPVNSSSQNPTSCSTKRSGLSESILRIPLISRWLNPPTCGLTR